MRSNRCAIGPANMLKTFAIFDQLLEVFLVLGEILIAMMCLHICIEVIANWFFGTPIEGTVEIVTRCYMVGVAFLPLAYIQRRNEHIKADIFTRKLPYQAQLLIDIFISILMVVMCALLGWYGYVDALSAAASNEAIELLHVSIPSWPTRWFVPFGFGSMMIVAVLTFIFKMRLLLGWQANDEALLQQRSTDDKQLDGRTL